MLEALELHLGLIETEKVGILIDADTDAGKRWCEVKQVLAQAEYVNLPDTPTATGTLIRQDGKPDVRRLMPHAPEMKTPSVSW